MRTVAIAIAMTFYSAAYSQSDTVLGSLAADLKQARAMPVGAKSSFSCPSRLEQLTGLPKSTVMTALGKPDFEDGSRYTYFLGSPVPKGQRGGGHPEIKFYSSASGTVERVSCSYAR
jgi:hypothetical protein